MFPPGPPAPPEGPPRGTYFSRRKATQPLPPLPAFTNIFASSTNTGMKLRKNCPATQTKLPQHSRAKKKTRSNAAGPRKRRRALNPSTKCSSATPLIRGGLGLLSWLNADKAAVTALVFKLHETSHEREQRVVLALADVFAR